MNWLFIVISIRFGFHLGYLPDVGQLAKLKPWVKINEEARIWNIEQASAEISSTKPNLVLTKKKISN